MIAFDLICSNGHKFECWFRNNDSFERQNSQGGILCPVCSDNHIEKVFTTFGIRRHGEGQQAKMDPHQVLRQVYEYIDKNFEEVGLDFAKEALKMHFGETEKRNIKGQTLPNEEKILKDEGVPFLKVPILKRLDN